jgi:hypothetical protein
LTFLKRKIAINKNTYENEEPEFTWHVNRRFEAHNTLRDNMPVHNTRPNNITLGMILGIISTGIELNTRRIILLRPCYTV